MAGEGKEGVEIVFYLSADVGHRATCIIKTNVAFRVSCSFRERKAL